MDILDNCLQSLDYLQHKVNDTSTLGDIPVSMTSAVSSSTTSSALSPSSSAGSGLWMSLGASTSAEHDLKRSPFLQAKRDTQLALAELSQPLTSYNSTTAPKPRPLSTEIGKVSNGHTYQLGKKNSLTLAAASGSLLTSSSPSLGLGQRGGSGRPNGWANTTTRPNSATSSTISTAQGGGAHRGRTTPTSTTTITTTASGHAHAPPIPPRSMISLNQSVVGSTPPETSNHHHYPTKQITRSATQLHSQPLTTVQSRRANYNRSVSTTNVGPHPQQSHPQLRNSSSYGSQHHHHSPQGNNFRGHPSLTRHHQQQFNHVEGQSSTVFIHHMKDARRVGGLTHLV